MYRHAIVDKNNKVINVVLWDGESQWKPRDPSHQVIRHDNCDMGDIYDPINKVFIKK
jgi:hypothetical protein